MAKYKTLINENKLDITISELLRNIVLTANSLNEAKLLVFLVTQKHGFNISNDWLMKQLFFSKGKLSEVKKKLLLKGFITETNENIIINYDTIIKKVAESRTDKLPNREQMVTESGTKSSRIENKKLPNREQKSLEMPEAVSVQDTDIYTNIDIDIYNNNYNQFLLKNFSKEELIEYIISLVSATAKNKISFTEKQKDYYENITQYIESGIINYDLPYDKEQMFCITKNINAALKTDVSYHDYYILTAIVFNYVKDIGRAMRIAAMIIVDYHEHSNFTDGIIKNLFYKDYRLLNNTLQTLKLPPIK